VAPDGGSDVTCPARYPPGRPRRTGAHPVVPSTARSGGTPIARIDDLMDKVDSKFHLVHLAAKRAREINGYYAQLGRGPRPVRAAARLDPSNKPLSIALEEIAQGKIEGPSPPRRTEDPLAFIEDPGDESA
jgi:DNA-directed RNA polymerase subunit omega